MSVHKMLSDHAKKIPVFWGHGEDDPIVEYDKATMSLQFLQQIGIRKVEAEKVLEGGIEFHAYPNLGHSADPQEIAELQTFLKKVIPPSSE